MKFFTLFFFLGISPILFYAQSPTPTKELSIKDSLTYELYQLMLESSYAKRFSVIEQSKKLINEGADPNGILHFTGSVRKLGSYIPILQVFYKNKYRKVTNVNTPFHAAIKTGDTLIVAALIKLGADINLFIKDKGYPITIACRKQDKKMITYLLSKGDKPERINLFFFKNINDIEYLVNKGADVSRVNWNNFLDDRDALKKLISLNPDFKYVQISHKRLLSDNDLFDFLLSNGMPENIKGGSFDKCPLFYSAIKYGNLYALKKLYAKQPKYINKPCVNNFKRTPLTIAVKEENLEIIKFLLENGADPMQKDWTGKTAINELIFTKNPEGIGKLLLEYGADIEYKGYFGQTPLMHAVKMDKYIVTMAYINLGANVNAVGKYEVTPLSLAVREESIPLLQLLIKHGADYHKKIKGKSILQYAKEEDVSPAVIQFLENL
ncbi:MAG: ankyrin repeat domain-containing protein [Bacteroidales bacterium]|nr:ankyrin repeat domain-containing protein [Bacteroidales bacterium]